MNPQVQEFIKLKEIEYQKALQEEKQEFYDRVGLSLKEYEDQSGEKLSAKERNQAYPYSEYADGSLRRYRVLYPVFTQEEYEAMKQAQERVDAVRPEKAVNEDRLQKKTASVLATFLAVLGFLIILTAFILGILMSHYEIPAATYENFTRTAFDFRVTVIYWAIGLFAGSVMLGLASMIENMKTQTELLKEILQK